MWRSHGDSREPGATCQAGGGATDPGIYDTLGRRFYVGVNAKF